MTDRTARSAVTMGGFFGLLVLLLLSVAFVADGGVRQGPFVIGGTLLSDLLLLAAVLITFLVVIILHYWNGRHRQAETSEEEVK